MKNAKFNSSNLAEGSYDGDTKELRLTFHSGSTYIYSEVPASTWEGITSAESAGKYFHQNIKGRYGERKA